MSLYPPSEDRHILEGKIPALLSYLSIGCIIPLMYKKDNPFVLAHGKQGLVLFVGEVAVFILQIVLGAWFLKLGMFFFGVISFLGIIASLKGEHLRLPIITDLAEKISL